MRLTEIKKAGRFLGRKGISQRAISLVNRFDGSDKGAAELIGRFSVLEKACQFDLYWDEKAFQGVVKEEGYLEHVIQTEGKTERDPPEVSVLVPIEVYRSMRETVVTSPRAIQNHVLEFLKSRGEDRS